MTYFGLYSTGLQIIYTYDEVAFIQNLIFYIEMAFRTPVSCHLVFLLRMHLFEKRWLYAIFSAF